MFFTVRPCFRIYYHIRNNQQVVNFKEFNCRSEDEMSPDWIKENMQNVSTIILAIEFSKDLPSLNLLRNQKNQYFEKPLLVECEGQNVTSAIEF